MDPVGSRRQLLRRRRRRRNTSLADKNAALDKDGPDFDEPNLMDWTVQIRLRVQGALQYITKRKRIFSVMSVLILLLNCVVHVND